MSLHPSNTTVSSHSNSLGAGDSFYQAIVGYNTQKLSSSSSPVQIIRQRYWCKPPNRKPLPVFECTDNEKCKSFRKIKNSIHISLEDLRIKSSLLVTSVRRKSTPNVMNAMESCLSEHNSRREKSQAARRVYELLMLNAWRKRKEDSAGLTNMVHYLTSELDKYKMQLSVAKSFMKQETKRNQCVMVQISILNRKLEEEIKIKEALAEEKEASKVAIIELEDKLSHETTLRSNVTNDLIEAKNEKTALEAQLAKERKKLGKIREDMASAALKVSELEEILAAKNESIDRMREINERQKGKLLLAERRIAEDKEAARIRCGELMEETSSLMRTISCLEGEKIEYEKELQLRAEKAKECETRIEALEKKINAKETKHEKEMKKAVEILCGILQERRKLELISIAKEQEMRLTARKILCKLIRLPLNLFSSITYIFSPLRR